MSDTPMAINQALEQVAVQHFLRAKMRLREPGKFGQEVSLSFSLNKNWYEIYHTLSGFRLEQFLGEAEQLHEKWETFGIGGFRPSDKRPEKYGRASTLLFPSEIAALFSSNPQQVPPQPVYDANSGGEEFSHPF